MLATALQIPIKPSAPPFLICTSATHSQAARAQCLTGRPRLVPFPCIHLPMTNKFITMVADRPASHCKVSAWMFIHLLPSKEQHTANIGGYACVPAHARITASHNTRRDSERLDLILRKFAARLGIT